MIAADILGFSGVQRLAVARARSLARMLRRPVYTSRALAGCSSARHDGEWVIYVPVKDFAAEATAGARFRTRLTSLHGAQAIVKAYEPFTACARIPGMGGDYLENAHGIVLDESREVRRGEFTSAMGASSPSDSNEGDPCDPFGAMSQGSWENP